MLKREIEQLGAEQLPLQQGLTASSHALDDRFDAMIIGTADDAGFIHAKVGVFFSGIITGCSCAKRVLRNDLRHRQSDRRNDRHPAGGLMRTVNGASPMSGNL